MRRFEWRKEMPAQCMTRQHPFVWNRETPGGDPFVASYSKKGGYISSRKQEATNMDTPRRHLKQRERSRFLLLQSIESDKQPANMELRRSPFWEHSDRVIKDLFPVNFGDSRRDRRASEELWEFWTETARYSQILEKAGRWRIYSHSRSQMTWNHRGRFEN